MVIVHILTELVKEVWENIQVLSYCLFTNIQFNVWMYYAI